MNQYKHNDRIVVKDFLGGYKESKTQSKDAGALAEVRELKLTVEKQSRQIRQLETIVEQLRIRIIQK